MTSDRVYKINKELYKTVAELDEKLKKAEKCVSTYLRFGWDKILVMDKPRFFQPEGITFQDLYRKH